MKKGRPKSSGILGCYPALEVCDIDNDDVTYARNLTSYKKSWSATSRRKRLFFPCYDTLLCLEEITFYLRLMILMLQKSSQFTQHFNCCMW